MSKREIIIDLGNTVKIYKMYNLSDNVNTKGIEFNKRGEPVGAEFICELKDSGGMWIEERYFEELKVNLFKGYNNYEKSSLDIETLKTLRIEFNNLSQLNYTQIVNNFRDVNTNKNMISLLMLLDKGTYAIMYLPVCSDGTTLSFAPNNGMIYSLTIKGSSYNGELGFFYIPNLLNKKEKCKYCGMDNTRKLDEKYHKDLKADYCCEECGEYFSTDKEENKFNKISKSNFREAVNSIPEIKTYKEAMSILLMTSLWLENSEIKEIERTIKKQWKRIYNKRLHESLNYIAKNYYCDINTKRVEKAWLQYIKFIMSITHSIDITDVKLEIE